MELLLCQFKQTPDFSGCFDPGGKLRGGGQEPGAGALGKGPRSFRRGLGSRCYRGLGRLLCMLRRSGSIGALQNICLFPEQKCILHLLLGNGKGIGNGLVGQGLVAVPQQVEQNPEGIGRGEL